jgi:hypothetical protein
MLQGIMRSRAFLWLVAVVILTALTYAPSLRNDFVDFDDGSLIFSNEAVKEFSPRTLHYVFTSFDPELYIPLTFVTYQIEYALFGMNPAVFHFTNVVLHVCNVILVALLIFLLTRRGWVALVCAALFALHPINSEAVLWASARKDLLSTFFFLASFSSYLLFRQRESVSWYVVSVVLFLLALLSKVSVVLLPLILILTDWLQGEEGRRHLKDKVPFFLLSGIFIIVAFIGKAQTVESSDVSTNVLLGMRSAAFYLFKMFVPWGFSVLYPQSPITVSLLPSFFLPALVTVFIVVLSLFLARRSHLLTWCILFYLLMLLPSFTNFQKSFLLFFASDHYAYVPSIGVFLFILSLLDLMMRGRGYLRLILTGGMISVILVLAGLTFQQTGVWRSTEALFRNTLLFYPTSTLAHNNIGSELDKRGDMAGAAHEFETAIALDPTYILPRMNIASLAFRRGETEEAERLYREAVNVAVSRPHKLADGVLPFFSLARCLKAQGKNDEALQFLEEAVRLAPGSPEAHMYLGIQYYERRRL